MHHQQRGVIGHQHLVQVMEAAEPRELCQQLPSDDPMLLERCVQFFEVESVGHQHSRIRARMARRFKHSALTKKQERRIADVIIRRLSTGRFSEQFKDQLRLAVAIDPERCLEVAQAAAMSKAEHVRRYAQWVLNHREK